MILCPCVTALASAAQLGVFSSTAVLWASGVLCAPAEGLAATKDVLAQRADSALPAQTQADEPLSAQPAPQQALPTLAPQATSAAPTLGESTGPPPEGAGPIEETTFAAQPTTQYYIPVGVASVYNCSDASSAMLAAEIEKGLPFTIQSNTAEPQVLILHTHATECYEAADRPWWDPLSTCRTQDTAQNMVAVGNEIAQQLTQAGITTLHDTTLHDYPSYTGSYANSRATAEKYLQQYPSIKVILDVHRDAIQRQDGTRIKPVATIDGEKAAQIMIICGANNDGNLPNSTQNLRFAARLADTAETMFPGLMRPVLYDFRFYNQDLTTGCLLLEMGGHANTLNEAKASGRFIGRALAVTLLQG